MRIKLKKGKQRELILNAKKEESWERLGKVLEICPMYLGNELNKEKRTLSVGIYEKLKRISNKNYDPFIVKKLNDNWGRSKGGLNSSKNTKTFIFPKESEKLAEFVGIMLGDGNINVFKNGKRVRCYAVTIAGDSNKDYEYHTKYISPLIYNLFKENPKLRKAKNRNGIYSTIYGINLIKFLKSKGLKDGNKKLNNQSIPKWILNNKKYLGACLRGLIDTDGSVHKISKNDNRIRISFTSHIPHLLNDVRKSFIRLGFSPSKVISSRQIYLTNKGDIKKYPNIIRFSNSKHLKRFEMFKR